MTRPLPDGSRLKAGARIATLQEVHEPSGNSYVFGVVILAAGRSSRMGKPKLLLPWHDTNVLGWHLHLWQALGAAQLTVVVSATGPVREALAELGVPVDSRIVNPSPEKGMFSSIRCASSWPGWKKSLSHFVLVLGDQPHVRRETLARLLAFSAANPNQVCQPGYAGAKRHPVLMPKEVFLTLSQSSGESLKQFLASLEPPPLECELDAPELASDIDTPEDYRRLKPLPGDYL